MEYKNENYNENDEVITSWINNTKYTKTHKISEIQRDSSKGPCFIQNSELFFSSWFL